MQHMASQIAVFRSTLPWNTGICWLQILSLLHGSGSQFIAKPAPSPEGKIICAPLAPFDVFFFRIIREVRIPRIPRTAAARFSPKMRKMQHEIESAAVT